MESREQNRTAEEARAELAEIIATRGIRLDVVSRLASRPGWERDPHAAHVRVLLTSATGVELTLTYSAGSEIVRRWALEHRGALRGADFMPAIGGVDVKSLETVRFPNYTRAQAEAIDRVRLHHYAPDAVDVVTSALLDCAGWDGPGPSFREWIEEGVAPENAADALECYEGIVAEYRFLRRALGADYDRASELAGEV